MFWKRSLAALCALALVPVFGRSVWARPVDDPLAVEIQRPPLVALTFDDGPRASTTGPLLDGLALREVPATFFLVGERLAGNHQLVGRMAADGHQIGVHTYGHVQLKGLTREQFAQQVDMTRAELTEILGPGDYWLRPPYGVADEAARAWADSPIVLWSVDPEDWRDKDVARIVDAVLEDTDDGDIILLHDLYPSSVEAALQVVDALAERGACFVTVEQLLLQRGIAPEKGQIYRLAPPR